MKTFNGSGFSWRSAFMNNGEIQLSDYLHTELSGQNKLLIGNVRLRIRLYRNKPSFSLCMFEDSPGRSYRIDITKAVLLIRKVKVSPSIIASHALTLLNHNVKYNVNRVDCRTFTLAKGNTSYSIDNLILGTLPTKVFIALIEESSVENYRKSPYNFKDFNLNSMQLWSDVHTTLRPITCNFAKKDYLEAYTSMLHTCGLMYNDDGNMISRHSYVEGNTIFGFNLNPDMNTNNSHMSLMKSGSLRLDMKFDVVLPESVTLIMYAEFNNFINITKERLVECDYSS
jgi:hypothetical protein